MNKDDIDRGIGLSSLPNNASRVSFNQYCSLQPPIMVYL